VTQRNRVPDAFVVDKLVVKEGLTSASFLPHKYHSTSSWHSGFSHAPHTLYGLRSRQYPFTKRLSSPFPSCGWLPVKLGKKLKIMIFKDFYIW